MKPTDETKMLHRMAAYCSTAERCILDVQQKIQAAGLTPEAGESIIAALKEDGFIDEKRYARCFVKDKLCFNKWGRIRITYELNKKNIPPEIGREVLDAIDETTYNSVLFSVLKEKKKTVHRKDEQEVFAQLLRFAAGRGFENEKIIPCLRRLLADNDYADDLG
ncbi:MAG: RecX family transcriptional regulator [Tannerellaceae bacterium]|jgi:regulatory protein|nr:RecX family transcriptional regulator [Tannerellaceae bacterium]